MTNAERYMSVGMRSPNTMGVIFEDWQGRTMTVVWDWVNGTWTALGMSEGRLECQVVKSLTDLAPWLVDHELPELDRDYAEAEYQAVLAHRQAPPKPYVSPKPYAPRPVFDVLGFITKCDNTGFSDGEEDELIEGLVQLRDSGLLYKLHGRWQRMARAWGVI